MCSSTSLRLQPCSRELCLERTKRQRGRPRLLFLLRTVPCVSKYRVRFQVCHPCVSESGEGGPVKGKPHPAKALTLAHTKNILRLIGFQSTRENMLTFPWKNGEEVKLANQAATEASEKAPQIVRERIGRRYVKGKTLADSLSAAAKARQTEDIVKARRNLQLLSLRLPKSPLKSPSRKLPPLTSLSKSP